MNLDELRSALASDATEKVKEQEKLKTVVGFIESHRLQ